MAKKNAINNKSDPLEATNLSVNGNYTFPNVDGANNQVMSTDGAGVLTWETIGGDGDLTWNEITSNTTASVKNAYICNSASTITITLPTDFAQGDIVKIVGKGTGGWAVKPNTGDTIYYLDESVGDTESFNPTNDRGCCEVHGLTNNTEWGITETEDTDFESSVTKTVEAGNRNSYVLQTNGTINSWGHNHLSSLGNLSSIDESTPVIVARGLKLKTISAGGTWNTSTLNGTKGANSIGPNGWIYAWGSSSLSGVGPSITASTNLNIRAPVQIGLDYTYLLNVSCGEHALAVRTTGELYAWGYNASGQIGDGTTVSKSSPVSVLGGHSFIKIAAGATGIRSNSAGLKANGEAFCWGDNALGQIGDGTTVSKSSPISVLGGHSFIDISISGDGSAPFIIALDESGNAYCWGFNGQGELGDGTITSRSSPVSVVGAHSFIKVSAGGSTNYGLKADGSAWAWGGGSYGMLGDGTTVSKSSPVSVIGGYSFIDIAGGTNHAIALGHDNKVYTWGNNDFGQLGNGTIVSENSPIEITGV